MTHPSQPDYALLIGVIISLVFFLWKSMHPRIVRLTWDSEHKIYFNAETHDVPTCSQIAVLRIDNAICFANAEYTVEHVVEKLDEGTSDLRYVLLDFKAVSFIDLTGIDELRSLLDELRRRGMGLMFISLHLPVRQVFESSGLMAEVGDAAIFDSYSQAMEVVCDHVDHSTCGDACPFAAVPECVEARRGSSAQEDSPFR